jgi:hypothetical protein
VEFTSPLIIAYGTMVGPDYDDELEEWTLCQDLMIRGRFWRTDRSVTRNTNLCPGVITCCKCTNSGRDRNPSVYLRNNQVATMLAELSARNTDLEILKIRILPASARCKIVTLPSVLCKPGYSHQ